jgi:outer membrane lipoprotein
VGEVRETIKAKLDEMDYQYPTVLIKHLHIWKDPSQDRDGGAGSWYGTFGGGSLGGRGGMGLGIGF